MKTLSVKQVAGCLGVSPRAVLKRLSSGQLKGTRRTNKYGVEEWWIYPNKEIRAALESSGQADILIEEESVSDADIIEIGTQNFAPDPRETVLDSESIGFTPPVDFRTNTGAAAEEIWNTIISRFLEELRERDQLIGEMRNVIAEKDKQLKLLPDLERSASQDRQESELSRLEAEALKKQIAALQAEVEKRLPPETGKELQEEKGEREREVVALKLELEQERQHKEAEIKGLKKELSEVEEYKRIAQEAQTKFEELQLAIDERVQIERDTSSMELRRIQEEKEQETAAIKAQLQEIAAKLEKPVPWWKSFFGIR